MIRITQQRDKCIGCNACVEAISSRWRISRIDGKSILIGAISNRRYYYVTVGDDEHAENMLAARNCPTRVIQVMQL